MTNQPLDTFRIDVHADTGTVYVPDTFKDNVQAILASLDFARVWNTRGTVDGHTMTARELRQAAQYAQALARQCERYATTADELAAAAS